MPRKMTEYSPLSKFFHWLIAIAVIGMLCFGFLLSHFPKAMQGTAYMLHKSTGLTILVLVILRFIWIQSKGKPDLPASVAPWERYFSRIVQYSLYLFLILMPLSGWIMSVAAGKVPVYYELFPVPFFGLAPNQALAGFMDNTHITMAWIIITLVSLHILGALKHHFIDKDKVLTRMLPHRRHHD